MSLAASYIKKVDSLLKKYGNPSFGIYKRTITRTGGDSLIGRPASVTTVDTLFTPQPVYARGMRRQVGGTDANDVVTNNSSVVIVQSYEMLFSPNAITLTDLENPNILLAFKDSLNNIELYRIEDFEPFGMTSTVVGWLVFATSMSR